MAECNASIRMTESLTSPSNLKNLAAQFTVWHMLPRQVKNTSILFNFHQILMLLFLGNLYCIGGPENFGILSGKKTQGYIINLESGKLVNTFNGGDEGFKMPHDVAVNKDGSLVYIVEISPFRIWKLSTGEHTIKNGVYNDKDA